MKRLVSKDTARGLSDQPGIGDLVDARDLGRRELRVVGLHVLVETLRPRGTGERAAHGGIGEQEP